MPTYRSLKHWRNSIVRTEYVVEADTHGTSRATLIKSGPCCLTTTKKSKRATSSGSRDSALVELSE